MKVYESIIVGGGPAGLSAAIYLARFNRSVLIIDKEKDGRWDTYEVNENYLGFPEGIKVRELRERGLVQAKKFGAEYIVDHIYKARKDGDHFIVESQDNSYKCKTLILATGVVDLFPHFDKWRDYVGRSLFWCMQPEMLLNLLLIR